MHRLQNSIGAGLQGQMNVLAKFGKLAKRGDQIGTKSNRMRRSKAKSLEAFNSMNRFEQLHKGALVGDLRKFVSAVEIHDLPEKGDFLHTPRDQLLNFLDNFGNSAAALGT